MTAPIDERVWIWRTAAWSWGTSMVNGKMKGATLEPWQRQAVLAAAAFLRERFSKAPADPKAKAMHDALLEVVEPIRRAVRIQKEMQSAAAVAALSLKSDRRARGRRTEDRRVLNVGAPKGVERRRLVRRNSETRRASR